MEEKKMQTRIITYALPRFLSYGFRAVRTDDLATELGISKKTIYRLFGDKKTLLREAVRVHLERIERELAETFDSGDATFPGQIGALFHVISERVGPIEPVFVDDLFRTAPEVWEMIDEFRTERILPLIGRTIRTGIRDGYMRSDLDVELVIRLLFTVVRHTVSPRTLAEIQAPVTTVIRHVQALFVEGILTDAGKAAWEKTYAQR